MTTTTNSNAIHNRTRAAEVTMIVMRGLVAVLLVTGLLVIPGAARASVVWTVCASSCNFTSINAAVNQSNPDDLIEVMPGTYPEQVVVTVPLHIFAPADEPRPVITNQSGITVWIPPAGAGTTISHLDIRSNSANSSALRADGAVMATDLALTSTTGCAFLEASAPSRLGPGSPPPARRVTSRASSPGWARPTW